jgi:hypothetical protein
MKKSIRFVCCSVVLLMACAIHKHQIAKHPVPEFKNQGEQEDYWTKKFFDDNYKKQQIERYTGNISIIDSDHIRFDKTLLKIYQCDAKFRAIFTNGIFYPSLISSDSLMISNVEEPSFLKGSVKVKRFKVLTWMPSIINPAVYFFEITNDKATVRTSTEDFIKGARLTFIKQGWIQI